MILYLWNRPQHHFLREVIHDYMWEAKGRENIIRPESLKYPKIPCTKSSCLQQETTHSLRDKNQVFMNNKPYSKQIFTGTGQILTKLFLTLFWSVWAFIPVGPGLPQSTASFRLAVISELAWPTAAAKAAHAYHLLLTGINKSLIWGNY